MFHTRVVLLVCGVVLLSSACLMSPDGVAELLDRKTEGLRGEPLCILEYNTALVPTGTDPCCRRQDGENQCDTKRRCNELSGGGCCIIYATEHTQGGQGCCLYEGGDFGTTGTGVGREAECRRLLTE